MGKEQTPPFAMLPRVVLRDRSLTRTAKCLYGALNGRAFGNGKVTAGCITLARDIGASIRQTKRSLIQLELCGLVKIHRQRRGVAATKILVPLAQIYTAEDVFKPYQSRKTGVKTAPVQAGSGDITTPVDHGSGDITTPDTKGSGDILSPDGCHNVTARGDILSPKVDILQSRRCDAHSREHVKSSPLASQHGETYGNGIQLGPPPKTDHGRAIEKAVEDWRRDHPDAVKDDEGRWHPAPVPKAAEKKVRLDKGA